VAATIDGASIASFLLTTPGLDRTAVGELLGDPDDLALACLKAYTQAFDFKGLHLSDALRKVFARALCRLLCRVCFAGDWAKRSA
jgi:Sec7-like guanine-nucleotide exchange factor